MKIASFIKKYWGIFVYPVFSILVVIPFFNPGFFNIHDNTQVERVYQMAVALSDGMFPVRWVPDLGYGYGYAIFNFYSVLPYYIGGFLTLFGIDALAATKIVFAASLIFSGVSMYILANRYFGNIAGLVASVIYLYFPYHAVNAYVRGDLAELFAYAFLPLVLFGFFEIYFLTEKNKKTNLYIVLSSVSLGLIVLSHNLTAFMLFIFLGLFIIISLFVGKNKKKLILNYVSVLFIGFLLSAFYSIPAVLEMNYSNVTSVIGGGSHYADHFVCISQLWNSQWGFGGSAPGCIDGISFKLGKINIVLSFISLAVLIFTYKKTKKSFVTLIVFIMLAVSIFLTSEYSIFLWRLPFMDFLQFPWRFINFTGLFIAFIMAYFVFITSKVTNAKIATIFAFVIISVSVFYNLPLFRPQSFDSKTNKSYIDRENISWTVSKISDEYLPRGFAKPDSKEEIPQDKLEIIRGKGEVSIIENKTNYISAYVKMHEGGEIRVNTAYFPAWKIYVNGNSSSYVIRNNGMYVLLPEGNHVLDIKFVETFAEKISNLLSIIGILVLIIVIIGRSLLIWQKRLQN